MTTSPGRNLLAFYSGWEDYHRGMVAAVAPLTAEQLDLKPAAGMWSVRMLLSHIVTVRFWWFHAWMGVGGPEMDPMVDFDEDPITHTRTAAEVVAGLEQSWALVRAALEGWTAADLDEVFQRPVPNNAGERPKRTRGWIVYHVLEHDAHHGGEVSLLMGMNGIPVADL